MRAIRLESVSLAMSTAAGSMGREAQDPRPVAARTGHGLILGQLTSHARADDHVVDLARRQSRITAMIVQRIKSSILPVSTSSAGSSGCAVSRWDRAVRRRRDGTYRRLPVRDSALELLRERRHVQ
jgi:hypothetical protein